MARIVIIMILALAGVATILLGSPSPATAILFGIAAGLGVTFLTDRI